MVWLKGVVSSKGKFPNGKIFMTLPAKMAPKSTLFFAVASMMGPDGSVLMVQSDGAVSCFACAPSSFVSLDSVGWSVTKNTHHLSTKATRYFETLAPAGGLGTSGTVVALGLVGGLLYMADQRGYTSGVRDVAGQVANFAGSGKVLPMGRNSQYTPVYGSDGSGPPQREGL